VWDSRDLAGSLEDALTDIEIIVRLLKLYKINELSIPTSSE
jgi:hypothetical protein